jgi:hypothetical protein
MGTVGQGASARIGRVRDRHRSVMRLTQNSHMAELAQCGLFLCVVPLRQFEGHRAAVDLRRQTTLTLPLRRHVHLPAHLAEFITHLRHALFLLV